MFSNDDPSDSFVVSAVIYSDIITALGWYESTVVSVVDRLKQHNRPEVAQKLTVFIESYKNMKSLIDMCVVDKGVSAVHSKHPLSHPSTTQLQDDDLSTVLQSGVLDTFTKDDILTILSSPAYLKQLACRVKRTQLSPHSTPGRLEDRINNIGGLLPREVESTNIDDLNVYDVEGHTEPYTNRSYTEHPVDKHSLSFIPRHNFSYPTLTPPSTSPSLFSTDPMLVEKKLNAILDDKFAL